MDRNLYRNIPIDPDDDDYKPTASAYDLTGLIPSAPDNDDEYEAYEEVYPYLPNDDEL